MSTATIVIVVLAAAWVGFSAFSLLSKQAWVVDNLADYGVPRPWWPWLGAAKALGALGLLVGLAVPAVGVAAAVGLALYFTGAVVTVLRAHAYSHVAYPLLYLAPAAGAGLLLAAAA